MDNRSSPSPPVSTTLKNSFPTSTDPNHHVPTNNSTNLNGCLLLEFLPWYNADNLISYDALLLFYRIFGGGLTPWISFSGFPMNVLNCVVFFKQGLKKRINLLLFLLACSDLIVCAFLSLSTFEYFITQVEGEFKITGPLVVFMTNYGSVFYGFVYVSGLISTLIAFERCICITYPFVAKRFMKTRTMAIGVCVVSALLIASVYFVSAQKYQIVCAYYPVLNITLAVHYPHEFYLRNKQLMDVLNTLVNGVSLPSFFGLVTTVTTVITAVKLKTAAQWRQTTSSVPMETKEVALTKMLVVVSCLFIVCTIPNIILRTGPVVDEEFRLGGRHQNALLSGVNVLYTANAVNCALNFVFYYRMGSKFRAVLKDLVCRGRGLAKEDLSTLSKLGDIATTE